MTIHLPTYHEDLFIDRDTELTKVRDTLVNLRKKADNTQRVIVFSGGRGLGKSWLSFHIKRTFVPGFEFNDVLCLLIGLGDQYRERIIDEVQTGEWLLEAQYTKDAHFSTNFEPAVKKLLVWIAEQIHSTRATNAASSDLSRWIPQKLSEPTFGSNNQYRFLVLLLDSVFETEKELLDYLEESLLAALAGLPNIMIIMTGRGKLPQWHTPSLRLTAVTELTAFPEDKDIEEQLGKVSANDTAPDNMAEATLNGTYIRAHSGGYPLNNLLAAHALLGKISWKDAVDEILSILPANNSVLQQALRRGIEAVAVLEGFRDAEMREMLSVIDAQQVGMRLAEQAVSLREALVRQQIVRWQGGRFELSDSIRFLTRIYLQAEQPMLYCQLHKQAYNLYQEWSSQYNNEYYRKRADEHYRALGADPNTINCQKWMPDPTTSVRTQTDIVDLQRRLADDRGGVA